MNELAEVISGALQTDEQTGSDYTAKVTRVEGQTAYVQITGSDIADTPVAMSISCKPGDSVRVRVADGKAWITGNDTSPPSDNVDLEASLRALIQESNNFLRKRIADSYGNYAVIEQTVAGLTTRVGTAEGNISTLTQTASGLTTRVGTAEGNISTLTQTASGLTTRVGTAEGNISTLTQTASGLTTRVTSAEGNISTLTQTANSLSISVGNAQTTADGRMKTDLSNRASSITINSGKIQFDSNTIVINSTKFSVDANGNATFAGTLNSAGGTFAGKVAISWTDTTSYYTSKITIGQADKRTLNSYPGILVDENGEQQAYTVIGATETTYRTKTTPTFWYNVSAYGATSSSDRRVKTDIKAIDPDLAKQLIPVAFRMVSNPEKQRYGFIAQDVQPVIPDVVTEGENGYLGLNYQELIAPLYALVQEQETRITQLEARLKELEEKLNEHTEI